MTSTGGLIPEGTERVAAADQRGGLSTARASLSKLLSIAGLSFWFIVGFPFEHHNESYSWAASIADKNLVEFLDRPPLALVKPRSLGLTTAFIGYRWSGGSIVPQQVFNFLVAAAAWLLLASAFESRRLSTWVCFVAGSAYFSGYIYLFHLHGVFYSPALFLLAFLMRDAVRTSSPRSSSLWVGALLTAIAALYHPFALMIFAAFLFGRSVEAWESKGFKELRVIGVISLLLLPCLWLLTPADRQLFPVERLGGVLLSYRLTEVRPPVAAVSLLLSLLTVFGVTKTRRGRWLLGVGVMGVAVGCHRWNVPLLLLWFAVTLVKSVWLRRWSVASLVAVTLIFPAFTGTGSPTYAIFAVMACAAAVPLGWPPAKTRSSTPDDVAMATAVAVLGVAALVRTDIGVPVASRLAQPLLAEREKTYQLRSVLEWLDSSDTRAQRLRLCQAAAWPIRGSNAADRTHRPPTDEIHLDDYMRFVRLPQPGPGDLYVCFGGETLLGAELVKTLEGRYGGNATVWRKDR